MYDELQPWLEKRFKENSYAVEVVLLGAFNQMERILWNKWLLEFRINAEEIKCHVP